MRPAPLPQPIPATPHPTWKYEGVRLPVTCAALGVSAAWHSSHPLFRNAAVMGEAVLGMTLQNRREVVKM